MRSSGGHSGRDEKLPSSETTWLVSLAQLSSLVAVLMGGWQECKSGAAAVDSNLTSPQKAKPRANVKRTEKDGDTKACK